MVAPSGESGCSPPDGDDGDRMPRDHYVAVPRPFADPATTVASLRDFSHTSHGPYVAYTPPHLQQSCRSRMAPPQNLELLSSGAVAGFQTGSEISYVPPALRSPTYPVSS